FRGANPLKLKLPIVIQLLEWALVGTKGEPVRLLCWSPARRHLKGEVGTAMKHEARPVLGATTRRTPSQHEQRGKATRDMATENHCRSPRNRVTWRPL